MNIFISCNVLAFVQAQYSVRFLWFGCINQNDAVSDETLHH